MYLQNPRISVSNLVIKSTLSENVVIQFSEFNINEGYNLYIFQ